MASVRRLLLAVSYDKENEALRNLLKPEESTGKHCLDLRFLNTEPPVLSFDEDDEGRNVSQSLLEDLLLYLVIRKFGASVNLAGGKEILGVDQHTLMCWERRNVQQPTEIAIFVETLHGLLLKSEWDAACVATLSQVVKRLQDPLVRQRFLVFSFQILRLSSQPKHSLPKMLEVDAKFFDEVIRLLLLGVTDLWSAIRKDSAKTAAAIAFEFAPQSRIEQFMDSLLCVAIGSRSVSADKSQVTAWTEREGALLALSVLLGSITTESTKLPSSEKNNKASQVKDDIKGILGIRQLPVVKYHLGSGRRSLTQLPRCLVQTLKPAIYQCIRHDQLSIRQLAAQCLVEYASLCEEPARLLIFQEVISKLNRINRNEVASESESAGNPNESELLDAFEAEGLLDVLTRMAPRLPSTFLLKHWKFVFPTLEKYVMHIASSVRQKSSSVVLALAKESLSSLSSLNQLSNSEINDVGASSATNESSLELMVQMLCSLSKQRSDGSSFCWQQKEGRLLSIDVLINVLGESLLSCGSNSCRLLQWKPDSTQVRQRNSGLLTNWQSFRWVHNQAQTATWVLDTDEEETTARKHNKLLNVSLIHAISLWIEKNSGGSGLPVSRHEFWQQILGGCIAQTKEAFESSQFELRRISRQVLPGLMRLVIWTEQLEFLTLTELKNAPAEMSWGWTCMKYILLHLRYLEEGMSVLDESQNVSISQRQKAAWNIVWNGILCLDSSVQNFPVDTDAAVIQVEVKVMAFLCFGVTTDSPRQVTRLLDGALRSIHKHLPETWQLRTLMGAETTASSDNSLDRQFCVFLVPILPAVIAILQYVAGCSESHDASTNTSAEIDLSSSSRWLCLERTALSWLLCDDMFRWITLSKSDAQSQILESLHTLLQSPNVGLSSVEELNEVDNIILSLHDVFATSKGILVRDTSYASLVGIYLQLWLRSIKNGNSNSDKVVVAITQLYSERQHVLALPNPKPTENTDSWDDDEDEVQQASPIGDIEEPQYPLTSDFLFQEALKSLDNSQRNVLREEAHSITELVGGRDIPTQHVLRMQQQIETCCTPNIQ